MFYSIITDIPPVTRAICFLTIVLSYITYIQVVQPANLYLNWKLTFTEQFQPWRIFTSILYFGQFDLSTIFRIYLLQRFSSQLEESSFGTNAGHYVYFLGTTSFALVLVSIFIKQHSLSGSFVAIILYVWSRKNHGFFVHIMGLLPLKAPYLSWFFMLMNIIIGESIRSDLVGILIGHTYYYLTDVLPKLPHFKDKHPLKTPKFLLKLCSQIHRNRRNIVDDDIAF